MATKKKTQTKAVVKTGNNAPAAVEKNQSLAAMYGDTDDDLNQSDLLISRILMAQSISAYVQDGKAKAGQLVGSLEHELLADKGKQIEIIPFHRAKTFRLFRPQPGGGTPKFIAEVPYGPDTKVWETKRMREVEWETTDETGKPRTEKLACFITWNYYCLLADGVEAMPRVVGFQSTSYIVGKKLGTFTLEAKKMGYPLPFKTYKLGTELVKNDKGTFYRFTVEKGRDTTDDELKHVTYWADLAKKGSIRVDEGADDTVGGGGPVDAPEVEKGVVDDDADY